MQVKAAAHKSKLSFQYGHKVLFETAVVCVCSPLIVATAKGSGKPVKGSVTVVALKAVGYGEHTENIALIKAIGGDDCRLDRRQRMFVGQKARGLWNRGSIYS